MLASSVRFDHAATGTASRHFAVVAFIQTHPGMVQRFLGLDPMGDGRAEFNAGVHANASAFITRAEFNAEKVASIAARNSLIVMGREAAKYLSPFLKQP